jgi:protease IV
MREFFKQTFASLIGSLFGLTLFFTFGTVGLITLIVTASKDHKPLVKNDSILVIDLSLNIQDTNPNNSTSKVINDALSGERDHVISLRSVVTAIDKATTDKRIIAIYLDGSKSGTLASGLATLKEVRSALERFRKSGKKIIAYNLSWDKKEYYLSSVANKIIINPLGMIELNGLRSEPMFLTGALDKYGIGVQVIRVGKYKSAVEPYILKQLSPENKQQTEQLLGDIWTDFKNTVATGRKINPQQIQNLADNQPLLNPEEAKKQGLIDKIAYNDEVNTELKQLTGSSEKEDSFRKISIGTYAEVADISKENITDSDHQIAVVYAVGEIVDGEGDNNQIGSDRFASLLKKIRADEKIKALVLRVNSPGGSATASDIIQRELILTKKVKPVIISMGDVAASGGYWISTYGDRIFAEENTITGSIGVFGLLMNVQKLANNNGITWDLVKTSKYADANTISRPKTPEELAIIQKTVDQIYYKFLEKVAQSRKIPLQKVAEIAQGRVWSGQQAKQIGLIDDIGGLDQAIAFAVKQAKLGKNWQLREYPQKRNFADRLLKTIGEDDEQTKQTKTTPLTKEFEKLQSELEVLKSLNDPQGIYARLPFNLKID